MRSHFGKHAFGAAVFVIATGFVAAAQNNPNREEPGVGKDPRLSEGQLAPVLEGLGDYSMPVTCKDARTQQFFDQGIRLAYGFNHKEAARAFQEALRLDPNCAMAYWGLAFVNGPNLNAPLDEPSQTAALAGLGPNATLDVEPSLHTRAEWAHPELRKTSTYATADEAVNKLFDRVFAKGSLRVGDPKPLEAARAFGLA